MTTSPNPIISLKNVSFVINQQSLVSHVNLTVFRNETISIIGPNGAGKSTLVKLILGLYQPSNGIVKKVKNLVIGYVPQKFVIPTILPLRVIDLLNHSIKNRLNTAQRNLLIEKLSLKSLLKQQMIHLSGGETQRVLLARALMDKPDLLILDEPMQGLDPETKEMLYLFIDELPDFLNCAMLVISHDLHWVMKGSRRVICLNKHICCEGQPADIQDLNEFQQLFGNKFSTLLEDLKFQQPYIHLPHKCDHNASKN